jgi:hypothetical protein
MSLLRKLTASRRNLQKRINALRAQANRMRGQAAIDKKMAAVKEEAKLIPINAKIEALNVVNKDIAIINRDIARLHNIIRARSRLIGNKKYLKHKLRPSWIAQRTAAQLEANRLKAKRSQMRNALTPPGIPWLRDDIENAIADMKTRDMSARKDTVNLIRKRQSTTANYQRAFNYLVAHGMPAYEADKLAKQYMLKLKES